MLTLSKARKIVDRALERAKGSHQSQRSSMRPNYRTESDGWLCRLGS